MGRARQAGNVRYISMLIIPFTIAECYCTECVKIQRVPGLKLRVLDLE